MTDSSYKQHDPRFFQDRDRITRYAAETIIPLVLERVEVRSVIDVGCGVGTWLAVFRERGIERIYGVEGTETDPELLQIPESCFERFDLSRPFPVRERYDLAMSLEVGEHLPPESAHGFVASLVELAPVVLFSAAIPGQGGIHHVNEQWPGYWVELFQAHDYLVMDPIRPRIWADGNIKAWYRQNILLFAHADVVAANPRLQQARQQTRHEQLDLVHPQMLQWKLGDHRRWLHEARNPTLGQVARMLPRLVRQSLASRIGRLLGRGGTGQEHAAGQGGS